MPRLQRDDLLIPQGTTWAARWPLSDSNGDPLITDGWTVRAQVRRDPLDDTVLHEWSTTRGNASVYNSFVELRVSPAESSAWDWGSAPVIYDIEVTLPSGEVLRLTQGEVEISWEVTR